MSEKEEITKEIATDDLTAGSSKKITSRPQLFQPQSYCQNCRNQYHTWRKEHAHLFALSFLDISSLQLTY